jgi:O-antigen/teichoic acid export membrane protein
MSLGPPRNGSPLRRVFKNLALLLSGRTLGAVLALASLALMARALGPANLGVVVLIHTYVLAVRGLLNFKMFEAIIRYGVPALEDGHTEALRRLLRTSASMDVVSALAGTAVSALGATIGGHLLGLDEDQAFLAVLYSATLLLSGTGTAKGALRLFDRFDILGIALVVGPLVRLSGVLIAFSQDAGVGGFAAAWALALAAEYLLLNIFGWRELGRRIKEPLWPGRAILEIHHYHRNFWRFVWVVYWQSTLDLVPKHFSTLFVGALLGSGEAGMFRVARAFSDVLSKSAVLLRQVLFPDLTRLRHQGGRGFFRFFTRVVIIVGIPALALASAAAVFAEPLLSLTVGEEYGPAAPLMSLLLFASALELVGATLRPAGYAVNRAGAMLRNQLLATVVYAIVFLVGTRSLGLVGPGIAACALMAVSVLGMGWVLNDALRSAPPLQPGSGDRGRRAI